MSANVSFNPYLTTNAAGSFNVQSNGFIQGMGYQSPGNRYELAGGVLAASETLPMFGGVAVYEQLNTPGSLTLPSSFLGNLVGRATTVTQTAATGIAGFSVFDQNDSMINSPASPVPLAGSGAQVNFYRLGAGIKVPVACDPGLVSLENGNISQNVSWDFNNQILIPYNAATATVSVTSMTWAATNGGQIAVVAAAATNVQAIGDEIFVSGATNTGTGGAAAVNGMFVVTAFTDSQHFIVAAPAAAGVIATIGGSMIINQGTGILPVKVLDLNIGGSMTVVYNSATNTASWNRSGSAALILI